MNNRKYSSVFPFGCLPSRNRRRRYHSPSSPSFTASPPRPNPTRNQLLPLRSSSSPFSAASAGENRRRARRYDLGALLHGRTSSRSHRRAGTGGQSRPEPVCRARSCATVAGGCWPTRQGRPACAAPCAEPSPPCHPQRQQWKWLSLYVVVAELC